MPQKTVAFTFAGSVPMDEVGLTLRLAQLAVECLHGEERVRLHAGCGLDAAKHTVHVDVEDEAGRNLASIFSGLVRREFGSHAVTARRGEPSVEAGVKGGAF